MGGSMPIFIIAGIAFIGWLMWSNRNQKEVFLFYTWAAMIAGSIIYAIYHWLFK